MKTCQIASKILEWAEKSSFRNCCCRLSGIHFIECQNALSASTKQLSISFFIYKSNALYMAYESAKQDALNTIWVDPPFYIYVTPLLDSMKELNYGKGYLACLRLQRKLTINDLFYLIHC